MKKYNLFAKTTALVLACTMITSLPGCSKKSNLTESTAVETTQVETTAEPETEAYVPELEGIDLTPEKISGHITKVATLDWNPLCDGKYLTVNGIWQVGSEVVAAYMLTDEPYSDDDQESADRIKNAQDYLGIWDPEENNLTQFTALPELSADNEYNTFIQGGNYLWHFTGTDGNIQAVAYDENLEAKDSFTTENVSGFFSSNGQKYYWINKNSLWSVSTQGGDAQRVTTDRGFLPEYFAGICPGENGHDLAVMDGRMGDLQEYRMFLDLTDGKFLSAQSQTGENALYLDMTGNIITATQYGENFSVNAYYDGAGYHLHFGANIAPQFSVSGNALILEYDDYVEGVETDVLTFQVFDPEKGEFTGSAAIQPGEMFDQVTYLPKSHCLLVQSEVYTEHRTYYRVELTDYVSSENEAVSEGSGSSGEAGSSESAGSGSSAAAGSSESASAGTQGAASGSSSIEKLGYDDTAAEYAVPEITSFTFDGGVLNDIEDIYDLNSYVPGTCSEEFSEERAKADELEKKYGVRIYLENEARMIWGNYAVSSLDDKDSVDYALEMMDTELAKYPDGFFEQMHWDDVTGIDIYLSGIIMGIGGDSLSYAGGFQDVDGTRDMIVLDITASNAVTDSLHHELAHAIDHKLTAAMVTGSQQSEDGSDNAGNGNDGSDNGTGSDGSGSGDNGTGSDGSISSLTDGDSDSELTDGEDDSWQGGETVDYGMPLLDESVWQSLNPDGFCYTYSYSSYDDCTMENPDKYCVYTAAENKVYFIDSYSKTYPTEDRARIFEHVMMDDDWLDITLYPHVMDKLNQYCEWIREAFDTTGWENVRWERYAAE